MLTVYHNAQCSKSNGVCQLLQDKNMAVEIVEYLTTPPDRTTLQKLLEMLDMQPSELIRRNEPIFMELYEGKRMNEEDYMDAMLQHPVLIERPIVVKDNEAIIGRPPERVLDFLG